MVDLSCNDRKRLSEASLGKIVNDKVFRNIKILNVFTKQWILAHVYLSLIHISEPTRQEAI